MLTLILQSALLLAVTFIVGAGIGWLLAGKRRVVKRMSVFDESLEETVEETPEVAQETAMAADPAEVFHYDVAKAAEQFTSGVVVPFKMPTAPNASDRAPYAPPETAPRLDVAATRVAPLAFNAESIGASFGAALSKPVAPSTGAQGVRIEPNLQGRVSSLATMTPESVEAAVQQAGTGLEPIRLETPRGGIDDLTVISGIGPGNQQELNALGIYHYWQIAGWTPEHVAWVSNRVRFPKRIVRENWMAQAARLAHLR